MNEAPAELWNKWFATRSSCIANEIIPHYLKIAEYHARKIKKKHAKLEYDMLYASGLYALGKAIEAYKPDALVKFSTFAQKYVWGIIINDLKSLDFVPVGLRNAGVNTQIRGIHDKEDDSYKEDFAAIFKDNKRNDDIWAALFTAFRSKYDSQWELLNLMYREGWNATEIAKYYGITRQAVYFSREKMYEKLRKSESVKKFLSGEDIAIIHPRGNLLGVYFSIPNKNRWCIVEGCEKQAFQKGRCRACYYHRHARGQLGEYKGRCQIYACENAHYAKGLCREHYYKKRLPEIHLGTKCKVENCTDIISRGGYCKIHYSRWFCNGKTGDIELHGPKCKGKKCSEESCEREAKSKGLCKYHYAKKAKARIIAHPPED